MSEQQIIEPSIQVVRNTERYASGSGEMIIRRTATTKRMASHTYLKPVQSRKNGTFVIEAPSQKLVSRQQGQQLAHDTSDQATIPLARRTLQTATPLVASQTTISIALAEKPVQQQQRQGAASAMIHAGKLAWSHLWRRPFLLTLVAFTASFLIPLLFYQSALTTQVANLLYSLNFDPERVVFLNQLLVILLGTALVGILFRRRSATILGAMGYFVVIYLLPFLIQVQQPGLGPGGVKQTLIPGAFLALAIGLLALGLTCAALGALIGSAYSEMMIVTGIACGKSIWQALRQRTTAPLKRALRPLLSVCMGLLILAAMLVGAGQANSLLTYGLTTNLYKIAPLGHTVYHGVVEQVSYTSPALGGILRTCYIYLPPSYSKNATERYPVLYLLHGSPGKPNDWAASAKTIEDTLLALGKVRETIIVSPDGNGPVYPFSEWANSYDGRQKMEDAIAVDLVQYVDSHFRTLADAEDRTIGGNSEGGYGAINLALHHPDIFGKAISLSGFFKVGREDPVFAGPNDGSYLAYNSPLLYVATPSGSKAARQIDVIIAFGSTDSSRHLGGAFYHELLTLGVHAQLVTSPGGHSWSTWRVEMGSVLPIFDPPLNGQVNL